MHQVSVILAGFGLSTFENADHSFITRFRLGAGLYLAPECEGYKRGFKKHTVSLPGDFWSVGYIVAEMRSQ